MLSDLAPNSRKDHLYVYRGVPNRDHLSQSLNAMYQIAILAALAESGYGGAVEHEEQE